MGPIINPTHGHKNLKSRATQAQVRLHCDVQDGKNIHANKKDRDPYPELVTNIPPEMAIAGFFVLRMAVTNFVYRPQHVYREKEVAPIENMEVPDSGNQILLVLGKICDEENTQAAKTHRKRRKSPEPLFYNGREIAVPRNRMESTREANEQGFH